MRDVVRAEGRVRRQAGQMSPVWAREPGPRRRARHCREASGGPGVRPRRLSPATTAAADLREVRRGGRAEKKIVFVERPAHLLRNVGALLAGLVAAAVVGVGFGMLSDMAKGTAFEGVLE